ncbi:hypothetical protein BKD09_13210 [Bradyrhizobium japonicum]|uniref:Uncharacterized protein n=1 Tax=Bradyrhizobium japonicum TaxID=375 RepID=A0A1L3F7K8_BRAJP|nr:hypothetical protein BKD09_13210 [Bradyrhizobium japonicum]
MGGRFRTEVAPLVAEVGYRGVKETRMFRDRSERRPHMLVMPRLDRGIQYAVASRLKHRLWDTGSPGQAGRRQRSKE